MLNDILARLPTHAADQLGELFERSDRKTERSPVSFTGRTAPCAMREYRGTKTLPRAPMAYRGSNLRSTIGP